MSIVFYSSDENPDAALGALKKALPEFEIVQWPASQPEKVTYAVAWGAPETFFSDMTGLQAIFSWGAGVDHLLNHTALPNVPVYRLEDAGMADKIADYVLYGVLARHRNFNDYNVQQTKCLWQPLPETSSADYNIGIMGIGVIGSRIAERLMSSGYSVTGWKRTPSESGQFKTYSGKSQLMDFLHALDALVCVLPLTAQTQQLIDQEVFNALPRGAQFINVGRGDHVVEADLLASLNSGQLSHALLDVCATEPLPKSHPLWQHRSVMLTPHIAGPTQEALSAQQVAEGIKALAGGRFPEGLVDRDKGY